jgi:phosphohistidine phosphatase
MAKQLFIIRHAKSDWKNSDITSDFDRPLNERGHTAAPEMAQRLLAKHLKPSLIVSSPAVRAFTTASYFAKVWKMPISTIQIEENIYEAGVSTLLEIINQFDDQHQSIAIFGHNPGFTDLTNYLTDANLANMPTASVVIVEFPFDEWKLVSAGTGSAILFDYPKRGDD